MMKLALVFLTACSMDVFTSTDEAQKDSPLLSPPEAHREFTVPEGMATSPDPNSFSRVIVGEQDSGQKDLVCTLSNGNGGHWRYTRDSVTGERSWEIKGIDPHPDATFKTGQLDTTGKWCPILGTNDGLCGNYLILVYDPITDTFLQKDGGGYVYWSVLCSHD